MSAPENQKLVMILEDSPTHAHMIGYALKEMGYSSVWVDTLPDAYACLRGTDKEFDAFIIDYQFCNENSTNLIIELKTSAKFSQYHSKPTIMITSMTAANFRETSDYRNHLESLLGEDIVHKTHHWKDWITPLAKILRKKLDDSRKSPELEEVFSQQTFNRYLEIFTRKRKREVEVTIDENGIISIMAIFNEPKTIEQATFEVLTSAIKYLEKDQQFGHLSNKKKAEMLGLHRLKYSRFIKKFFGLASESNESSEKTKNRLKSKKGLKNSR